MLYLEKIKRNIQNVMQLDSKNIVESAGIALVNNGRIFLIRPLFNNTIHNFGIPKGRVELGETPECAAEREFEEETGISLCGRKKTWLCDVCYSIDKDTLKKVIVFMVIGDGTEKFIKSNISSSGDPENVTGCYVDYNNAMDMITPYQKSIIEKVMVVESHSLANNLSL